MSAAKQTAPHLGGYGVLRIPVERIAAEEVDLLQLGKQARAGIAARDPLHFVDGQILACVGPIGVELVAAVEMTRDHEHIATDTGAARRCQPIGPASFHQLDELEFIGRDAPAKYFLFVGRVDGDRANRFLVGLRFMEAQ